MYGLKGRGIEDDVISQPVNTTVPSPAQKCKTHHIYIYYVVYMYTYMYVYITYGDIARSLSRMEVKLEPTWMYIHCMTLLDVHTLYDIAGCTYIV